MSEINEANIIDVDDASIKENTPMMLIEQGGKTIAVPITAYIIESGDNPIPDTPSDVSDSLNYSICYKLRNNASNFDVETVYVKVGTHCIGWTEEVNGQTAHAAFFETTQNDERVFILRSYAAVANSTSQPDEIRYGNYNSNFGTGWYGIWTLLDTYKFLSNAPQDATLEELVASLPTGYKVFTQYTFGCVADEWEYSSVFYNSPLYKSILYNGMKGYIYGKIYNHGGELCIDNFPIHISDNDNVPSVKYIPSKDFLPLDAERTDLFISGGEFAGHYVNTGSGSWEYTAKNGTKYALGAGISDCMITNVTTGTQLYMNVYKEGSDYPQTAEQLVSALDSEWWDVQKQTSVTGITIVAVFPKTCDEFYWYDIVTEFTGTTL